MYIYENVYIYIHLSSHDWKWVWHAIKNGIQNTFSISFVYMRIYENVYIYIYLSSHDWKRVWHAIKSGIQNTFVDLQIYESDVAHFKLIVGTPPPTSIPFSVTRVIVTTRFITQHCWSGFWPHSKEWSRRWSVIKSGSYNKTLWLPPPLPTPPPFQSVRRNFWSGVVLVAVLVVTDWKSAK